MKLELHPQNSKIHQSTDNTFSMKGYASNFPASEDESKIPVYTLDEGLTESEFGWNLEDFKDLKMKYVRVNFLTAFNKINNPHVLNDNPLKYFRLLYHGNKYDRYRSGGLVASFTGLINEH